MCVLPFLTTCHTRRLSLFNVVRLVFPHLRTFAKVTRAPSPQVVPSRPSVWTVRDGLLNRAPADSRPRSDACGYGLWILATFLVRNLPPPDGALTALDRARKHRTKVGGWALPPHERSACTPCSRSCVLHTHSLHGERERCRWTPFIPHDPIHTASSTLAHTIQHVTASATGHLIGYRSVLTPCPHPHPPTHSRSTPLRVRAAGLHR